MAGAERLSGAAARLRHRPLEPSSPVKAIEVHTGHRRPDGDDPRCPDVLRTQTGAARPGPRRPAELRARTRRVDGEGRS
eukprot:5939049-Prymnesium_polylepis.1